jgi:hypothetical protein
MNQHHSHTNEEDEFIFTNQKAIHCEIIFHPTVYFMNYIQIQSKQKICSMPHFRDNVTLAWLMVFCLPVINPSRYPKMTGPCSK